MLLIHQRKGVVIFNMKKVRSCKLSTEELREDVRKHRRFIELLIEYQSVQNLKRHDIPIHAIICNFQNDSEKFKCLEDKSDNVTLVFNKSELAPSKFPKVWADRVNAEIKSSVEPNSALEILVARLISLSPLESSAALIHQNMQSGFLQSMKKPEHLKRQISAVKKDRNFSEDVIKLSETQNQKAKLRYILWTKEQMDVIAHVYDGLINISSNNGMRVLVEGGKGSGKTMLLVFIAKLAQRVFGIQNENYQGNVMVTVGDEGSSVFMKQLRATFNSKEWSQIAIHDNPCKFFFCTM